MSKHKSVLTRLKWFLHFLRCAITERKGRVAVASASVMMASALVVSAMGISMGIREKLGQELKAYGSNVLISSTEGYIEDNESLRAALSPANGIQDVTGQLYATASIKGAQLEVMGLELARAASAWKVEGALPGADRKEVLVGANLKAALKLEPGSIVEAELLGNKVLLKVTGFVERGGPEDSAILMPLSSLRELTALQGKLSAVLLRADSARLDSIVDNLKKLLPGLKVKTLRQVARAEESFLGKIELLMALVAGVVLVAAVIGVSSTMSATVLERLKEIGLMKALGGTRTEIGAFYLAEGIVIGVLGGVLGYLVGLIAAEAVSRGAFGSFITVPLSLLTVSLALGIAIAIASSLLPLMGALRYRPSVILRGE